MSCPKNGPCSPYITELDLCCLGPSGTLPDPCLISGEPVPQAVIDSSIQAASELLWALTGRQFGTCQTVIRPCSVKNDCEDTCVPLSSFTYGFDFPWFPQHLANGTWINVPACGPGDCCTPCAINLPYPTCTVDQVKIDGEVLLDTQYEVLDFKELVKVWEYGKEKVAGVQLFTSVGGTYCYDQEPSSVQFGPLLPGNCVNGGTYSKFGEGDFADPDTINFTFTDPVPAGPTSGFGFSHPTLGFYTWPTTLIPMDVGETRKSDVMIDGLGRGHYATITYVSGPANAGPAATNPNFNPQSNFWDVDTQEPRSIRVEFFGPVAANCWPKCQDLRLEDSQPDTFSVTVTYGRIVPELVKLAAAKLACELILSCVGQPCQLPQRVTNITRQGVTMTMIDPQVFLKDGFTGIYLVDQAILTYNPHRLARRPSVYSPDVKSWRRVTG